MYDANWLLLRRSGTGFWLKRNDVARTKAAPCNNLSLVANVSGKLVIFLLRTEEWAWNFELLIFHSHVYLCPARTYLHIPLESLKLLGLYTDTKMLWDGEPASLIYKPLDAT
jgi:hypothetical protein